jgi:alanine racemase
LDNSYFIQFMRGIARVCDEQGLSLMLVPVVERVVTSATADGFVVVGLEPDDPILAILGQRHLPMVTVDSELVDGISSVNVDDVGGASKAMQYAIDCGHRRMRVVAFESGKEGQWHDYTGTLRWRLKGYLEASARVGLSLDGPDLGILECENSLEGGGAAFRQFWQEPVASRPTAVLAMSDMIAIGIIQAARDIGLEIPRDLSVIGYDDIPEAQRIVPPLTTVRQPIVEKAELAAELLVRTLAGQTDPQNQLLPTEFVMRETAAPPPSPK